MSGPAVPPEARVPRRTAGSRFAKLRQDGAEDVRRLPVRDDGQHVRGQRAAAPAVHGVVRDQHLLRIADAEERDQRCDAQLVREQDLQSEAVERQERALVEDADVVGEIGAVVGVQPFGGSGLSGTGPKAGGPDYLRRFAMEQVVSANTAAVGGNASLVALDDG